MTALTDAKGLLVARRRPCVVAARGRARAARCSGAPSAATSRVTIVWPIVRTAAISLVALVVFGGLFASGDAIFGSWASALVPEFAWDSLILRVFVGFVMGGALLAAGYVALNPPRVQRVALPARAPVARVWEWAVPVGLVVALFVAFVVAQAAALFGGHDYVQRTTGLTYADYVHQGFGQLTAATAPHPGHRRPRRAQGAPGDGPRAARPARRRSARSARADPRRRRVGAAPDGPLPAGLRLHRAAGARRRRSSSGSACSSCSCSWPGCGSPGGGCRGPRWSRRPRFVLVGGLANPEAWVAAAQHRPLRRDRQARRRLPRHTRRRRHCRRSSPGCLRDLATCIVAPARRPPTTSSRGTSAQNGRRPAASRPLTEAESARCDDLVATVSAP